MMSTSPLEAELLPSSLTAGELSSAPRACTRTRSVKVAMPSTRRNADSITGEPRENSCARREPGPGRTAAGRRYGNARGVTLETLRSAAVPPAIGGIQVEDALVEGVDGLHHRDIPIQDGAQR